MTDKENNTNKIEYKILSMIIITVGLLGCTYLYLNKDSNIAKIVEYISKTNIINNIFKLCNYVNLEHKFLHNIIILSLILIFIISFLIGKSNSILYVIIILYLVLIFFINGMNAKRVCGKSMGILESFGLLNINEKLNKPNSIQNFLKYNYFNPLLKQDDYITSLKDYICFENDKLTGVNNHKKNFTYQNTKTIHNQNSNYYNLNDKNSYIFDYDKSITRNTGKYITLTIYNFILIVLALINLFSNIKNYEKTLKFSFSILFSLTIFIWVCVLNYPLWIIILFLLLIVILWITIGLLSAVEHKGEKLDDDFYCQLHIIPIVNKSWTPYDFNTNFKNCIEKNKQSFFLKIFGPYIKTINDLETQISNQDSKLNNITTIITNLKEKMNIMVEQIYNKIKQVELNIVKISTRIFDIFKDMFNIFKFLIFGLISLANTGAALNNSLNKVGNIAANPIDTMFCFDPDIQIKLLNSEEKKIIDIKINDILFDGSKVLGVLKCKYSNEPMYNYKNIIVSGSHYVLENNIHKQICKCSSSILINYDKEYVYSLITDTQKILINNITFNDYFDINNNDIQNKIQNKILSLLNDFEINDHYENRLPLWGFYKNTKIKMKTSEDKIISHIKIGDLTEYGKVTSVVKLKINNSYKYKNIITTGDQIVKENNIWIRVKDCMMSERCNIDDNIFYHISVESNKLKINNDLFTDFEQINNYGYFEFINLVNL